MPFTPDEPQKKRFVADTVEAEAPEREPNTLAENIIGGLVEPIASMGAGIVAQPVSRVIGLGALASKMLPEGLAYGGDPQTLQQNVQSAITSRFEPVTEGGRSPNNPLNFIPQAIGNLVSAGGNWAGEQVRNPSQYSAMRLLPQPVREALASGMTEAVEQAPGFIGAKAGPAMGGIAREALQGEGALGARGVMERALKPSLNLQKSGKAADAITTMLDEGIDVSKGSLEKLHKRISELENTVQDAIANSPATVNKYDVSLRLMDTFDKFKNAVHNKADLSTIREIWSDFLNRADIPGATMPVQKAQAMKQATYQKLKNAYEGKELKSAEKESLMDVNRGFREEIGAAVPSVRGPLAQESSLMNVLDPLQDRVFAEAKLGGGGLGWLNPKYIAAFLTANRSYPLSKIAHGLNKSGDAAYVAGQAGAPIGMAVAQQAQEEEARRRLAELLSMGQ